MTSAMSARFSARLAFMVNRGIILAFRSIELRHRDLEDSPPMPDFSQQGPVTTIHDLGTVDARKLESMVAEATDQYKIGLVLPVTASDMRAEPFANIIHEIAGAEFLESIVVVLNRTESAEDYRETAELIAPLGEKGQILWTDGARVDALISDLASRGFNVSTPGKGKAVWAAFGYLLANPRLKAFVLHDCDIVNFEREMLVRLCLPMAHPSLDFDFCKAYYARCTDRMHGRVARLLVCPGRFWQRFVVARLLEEPAGAFPELESDKL